MILISHPTGNANVRNAALALAEADLLAEFWTCVAWNPASPLSRILPRAWRDQLNRRALPPILQNRTHLRPWYELGRHLCPKFGLGRLARHEEGIFSVDGVYRALDRDVARAVAETTTLTGVYCYEDGAAATFAAARDRGLRCLYDLPIGYWRAAQKIYAEETEQQPAWRGTLSGTRDSAAKLERKEKELLAADVIIVASSFTRQTLAEAPIPGRPVEVIPYGSPTARATNPIPRTRPPGTKLRVLFVGSLGQRKGLSYLIEAVEILGRSVELTLIGRKTTEECSPLNEATRRYRWIPSLTHEEVLAEMSRHDVLVFPSLFEGFGLVILEAMAQGLPVVTTPNTAGPDILCEGESGFIVPIRDAVAIAGRLESLSQDDDRLFAMKRAAQQAAATFCWAPYRERLANVVREAVGWR